MYLENWNMQRRPFDNGHDPALFVPVESAMLILTRLRYAVSMGLGIACLSGEPGCGKSELARMCMMDFATTGWATVYIANPSGNREEVFLNILHRLDGEMLPEGSVLESLERRVEEIGTRGGRILLVVDDGHAVDDVKLLSDIRMLYNIEVDGKAVFSMILVGQKNIYGKLSEAGAFDNKVGMKIQMVPFNDTETEVYMLARLKASGCTRGVFTKKAAEMVYQASGGIASNINRICELALITAFANELSRIKPDIIVAVARELGLRNDLGTQRMLDEVWSDDLAPLEKYAEEDVDILADLAEFS